MEVLSSGASISMNFLGLCKKFLRLISLQYIVGKGFTALALNHDSSGVFRGENDENNVEIAGHKKGAIEIDLKTGLR